MVKWTKLGKVLCCLLGAGKCISLLLPLRVGPGNLRGLLSLEAEDQAKAQARVTRFTCGTMFFTHDSSIKKYCLADNAIKPRVFGFGFDSFLFYWAKSCSDCRTGYEK